MDSPTVTSDDPSRSVRRRLWLALVVCVIVVIGTMGWNWSAHLRREQHWALYQEYLAANKWKDDLKREFGAMEPILSEIREWESTVDGTPYVTVFNQIDRFSDRVASLKDRVLARTPSESGRARDAASKLVVLTERLHAHLVAVRRRYIAEQKLTIALEMFNATQSGIDILNEGEYSSGPIYDSVVRQYDRLRKDLETYRYRAKAAGRELDLSQEAVVESSDRLLEARAAVERMLAEPKTIPLGLRLEEFENR